MNKRKLNILIESEVKHPRLTQQQIEWLNHYAKSKWYYQNGVVNVRGDVVIDAVFVQKPITTMPVQFGEVTGDFNCGYNKLTSLKGCPYIVGGYLYCGDNKLTSLEYMPKEIGGKIYFPGNQLILNDKLFKDLANIGGKEKIESHLITLRCLKNEIPIQFGITDKKVIDEIWQSYMDILEGKTNE